jgi:hypothetical protein
MTEQQASSGPSVKQQPGGETPQWWREATPERREAWLRLDRELAEQLGTARPYAHGPWVGTCPGSESGHGLTASPAYAGGCCSRWGKARTAAIYEGRAEITEIDRLMATDPGAGRLAVARQKLEQARSTGAYPNQIEQLEMRVRACEVAVETAHTGVGPARGKPSGLDTGARGERYMDTQAPVAGLAAPARDLEAGE